MNISVCPFQWLVDKSVNFHRVEQLLEDKSLKFEARHVTVVSHHREDIFDDQQVEILIKDGSDCRLCEDQRVQSLHCFKSNFHELRFLMFHCEQNCQDHCLELLWIQLKQSSRAVLDNFLNKAEATLSELWIWDKIVLNHVKSGLTKVNNDLLKVSREALTHTLHHCRKEQEYLRVPCIRVILSIVLN